MCACDERRAALGRSLRALADGDMRGAVGDVAFVGRSAVSDAAMLASRAAAALSAARMRLARR